MSTKIDFGKVERGMALFSAAQIVNMQCTCDDLDCQTETLQQLLAVIFAQQIMSLIETRQAIVGVRSAFRGAFG